VPQAALLRFDPGALESSGENEREDKNIYFSQASKWHFHTSQER